MKSNKVAKRLKNNDNDNKINKPSCCFVNRFRVLLAHLDNNTPTGLRWPRGQSHWAP